jgi:hypothetical protein
MGGAQPTEIDHASVLVRDICKSGGDHRLGGACPEGHHEFLHRVIVIHHGEKIAVYAAGGGRHEPVVVGRRISARRPIPTKKANQYAEERES